uniref:N-acetylglucosaminidase n=1 Tax=Paucisalibacillus globulus TaxID=351095 RepID=UPI000686E553
YKEFKVNLTEKVGDNTWYRGTYEGSDGNIWIHPNHLTTKEESNISRVGQIRDTGVEIYQQLDDISSIINANSTHINRVFYIKKQTIIDGKTFYLLSNKPNSEDGLVGWVNKNNVTSYSHVGVDKNNKIMYLKGTGYAYDKIWGGSENIVFPPTELEKRKGYGLQVNLTEKVGNNTWYRGILDGKEVWIHSNHVSTQTGNETSKLGKIMNSSASIFKSLGDSTSIITAGEVHTGLVYYIKRETILHGKTYYLISNQPSSTIGTVGWVDKDSMETHDHVGIDSKSKTFYLKGTGVAYNRPWGGTKNVVYNVTQMEDRKGAVFQVQLTQKVGSNTWYRGKLDGQTVWIHSSHLNSNNYTTYNLTLEQALTMQMKVNPQTDKYRNNPGYVSAEYIDLYGLITGTTVNLRTSPTLTSSVKFSVKQNTKFEILDDNVKGDTVSNSTRWYKIKYSGSTVYVHSSLAKIYGTTNANVNVRETASSSTSSHIYGLVPKGTTLSILDMGSSWHKVSYNTWRSAKKDDVSYYLDPNNFVNDPIQRFQFFDISKPSGISASALNTLLSGKGILNNKGQYFVQAEKSYGVNAVYLVAHALLETGHGTSELANGVVYKGVKVHNMYGINAFDSNPRGAGAEKAYNEGWTTPERAILGGAKWIADNYIYVGQNTIYNMRWNPVSMDTRGGASHQYATDIGWASKQVNTMYQIYKQINNVVFQFDIPKYK